MTVLAGIGTSTAQTRQYVWSDIDCRQSRITVWPGLKCRATNIVASEGNIGVFRQWAAFGTSRDGMPINVQVVGAWQAEATILHIASLLEGVSPVKNLFPDI